MKEKHPNRTTLFFLVATLFSVLLICILLSSCEFNSIVDSMGTGANDVFLPVTESTTTAPVSIVSTTPPPSTTTEPPTTTTASPVTTTQAPIYYNPLSALPCDKAISLTRPIGLCVNEDGFWRAPTADLVIEAPTAENGQRYLLLNSDVGCLDNAPGVSSIRPYLAALSHDFFGISVYRGTSDNGRPASSFLYDTIDTSLLSDNATVKEAYLTADLQKSIANTIALPFDFVSVGSAAELSGAPSYYVSVPFYGGATTSFSYDALSGVYTLRKAQAPQNTVPPSFSNLFILFFDSTVTSAKDGTVLTLDTATEGEGYYISKGVAVKILWKRDSVTSSLSFTLENGERLTVNRGRSYIAMTDFSAKRSLILN